MFKKIFLIFFCLMLTVSMAVSKEKKAKASESSMKVTGTVVDQAMLTQGGTFGFTALKAGPNAEANEELDRVSMMVLKGIKDILEQQASSLRLIDNTKGHPQIILEGYVEDLVKPGKMARMMLRPNRWTLSLVGDLWLTSNGKRILEFSVTRSFNPKREPLQDVAYGMGQEIGRFIVYNTSKEKL